jgi:LemA protein
MKATQILAWFALALVLVVLLGAGCTYKGYNHLMGLDEDANQAWAEVDNQLKRRSDLIPELVETVRGVAGQEQAVMLGIAEARKAYGQSQAAQTVDEKVAASRQMDTALAKIFVLQEQYPELKSSESFLKLQDSLEGTENRLVEARRRYNQTVMRINSFARQFPGRIFVALFGVEKRKYFETEAEERAKPKVDFSDLRKPTAGIKTEGSQRKTPDVDAGPKKIEAEGEKPASESEKSRDET